jgi:hypothetical protein
MLTLLGSPKFWTTSLLFSTLSTWRSSVCPVQLPWVNRRLVSGHRLVADTQWSALGFDCYTTDGLRTSMRFSTMRYRCKTWHGGRFLGSILAPDSAIACGVGLRLGVLEFRGCSNIPKVFLEERGHEWKTTLLNAIPTDFICARPPLSTHFLLRRVGSEAEPSDNPVGPFRFLGKPQYRLHFAEHRRVQPWRICVVILSAKGFENPLPRKALLRDAK